MQNQLVNPEEHVFEVPASRWADPVLQLEKWILLLPQPKMLQLVDDNSLPLFVTVVDRDLQDASGVTVRPAGNTAKCRHTV